MFPPPPCQPADDCCSNNKRHCLEDLLLFFRLALRGSSVSSDGRGTCPFRSDGLLKACDPFGLGSHGAAETRHFCAQLGDLRLPSLMRCHSLAECRLHIP